MPGPLQSEQVAHFNRNRWPTCFGMPGPLRSESALCGSVVKAPSLHPALSSAGSYSWSGRASTYFFIDPDADLVAVLMSQHLPNNPDQLFERFRNLVYQAIVE